MEHNGHDWSVQKQQVLGQIRAGLEHAKSFVESLEERSGASPKEAGPIRRSFLPGGKMAAVALAAALDLAARRRSAAPVRKRRPGIFKLALLSAAVLAAGKLIAARR
jgi:hypothetical protein